MAFIEKISGANYRITKVNNYIVEAYHSKSTSSYIEFDFVARVVRACSGSSDGGKAILPFAGADPETLHFFREQLIALGGNPPELPDDIVNPAAAATEAWVDMGTDSIAHVAIYPPLQKKITRIFNFESRQLDRLTENLRTHSETAAPTVCFDDLPETTLVRALAQFEQQGKTADREFVLRGGIQMKKPRLP